MPRIDFYASSCFYCEYSYRRCFACISSQLHAGSFDFNFVTSIAISYAFQASAPAGTACVQIEIAPKPGLNVPCLHVYAAPTRSCSNRLVDLFERFGDKQRMKVEICGRQRGKKILRVQPARVSVRLLSSALAYVLRFYSVVSASNQRLSGE